MLVTKYIEIDMGHRVPNHKSKCQNLHGHRYKIEVGVDDKVILTPGKSNEGMVIDFSDLKAVMMKEIDEIYDHSMTLFAKEDPFLLDCMDELKYKGMKINFTNFIPTAENLAEHWYEIMKPKLAEKGVKIEFVRVWETPSSTATYQE